MKHRTDVRGRSASRIIFVFVVALIIAPGAPVAVAGSSDVLAEVKLKPSSKIEKGAGIWVDGQYLGYLSELKGSKKILLLQKLLLEKP